MIASRSCLQPDNRERLDSYLVRLSRIRHDPHERAAKASRGLNLQVNLLTRPSRFGRRRQQ